MSWGNEQTTIITNSGFRYIYIYIIQVQIMACRWSAPTHLAKFESKCNSNLSRKRFWKYYPQNVLASMWQESSLYAFGLGHLLVILLKIWPHPNGTICYIAKLSADKNKDNSMAYLTPNRCCGILVTIILTSNERHAVSNHGQLNHLLNSLFIITPWKTPNLRISGPL